MAKGRGLRHTIFPDVMGSAKLANTHHNWQKEGTDGAIRLDEANERVELADSSEFGGLAMPKRPE